MKFYPLILAMIFFAGCARFQPQPISPERTAAQLESRRLDDAGLKKFLEQNSREKISAWPQTNWDLNSLTLAAFYFHPGLEVARAQWLVAAAGIKTAGARPNPSVTVTPGYDSQIPGNYSPWLVPITFDLPIETMGKRGKRMAAAEKASESARWNFVSAAWQIRRDVRASLVDFKISGQRENLLHRQFSMQKEIVKLLQQRFDAGEISQPELTIAKITLNKSQMDLNDAESQKIAARSHLAEALGLSESTLAGQNFDFDFRAGDLKKLTSRDAREITLRSRADVLAALANYATAEDDLRLQIAKQFPDLHLSPGYAWNNGNAGDNQWSLGVTLELPILDQNQGPIAEAEARRKLAAAKFMELQARIIAQIDRAVADFHAANRQLKTGDELFAAERESEKSVQAQFAAGATERLDFLNAQLILASAARAQLDNEQKWQSAIGVLEDALQMPNDSLAAAIQEISSETLNGNLNKEETHP